ncbi:MAG: hypothetical protein EZS28_047008, partial [Streblomastix strix]
TEVDALLDNKLNITDQIDAYAKQDDDTLLLLKADKTKLNYYVDLTSTQTIICQKKFGIINVSNVSKQNLNDTSILLAGGGDMSVSSLISQPQLQQIRDISSGKSKGYVFATTVEMNSWMQEQENIEKLAIGYILYIIDKQVMDYLWDDTGLRALETELPDINNIMTIAGTATGGGNAITDLSFIGNTLVPAKNIGKMVQNYDSNSVVRADGGVKAVQDINANQIDAYTKGDDDALLLLKADKTQLIDAYTK